MNVSFFFPFADVTMFIIKFLGLHTDYPTKETKHYEEYIFVDTQLH